MAKEKKEELKIEGTEKLKPVANGEVVLNNLKDKKKAKFRGLRAGETHA